MAQVPGRRLRPHGYLFRQYSTATIVFLVPLFSLLYVFTIPNGPWLSVVIIQAVAMAVFAVVTACYFRVAIWIDERGIAERGFFGGLTVLAAADIGSIVLVHTYHAGGADTMPQLFVCDHDGNQAVRLRGQYWSLDAMRDVADTLDVPLTELSQSVTNRELLARYPGLLYWFERRPVLAAGAFSVSVVTGGMLLYLGLDGLGITSALRR